MAMRFGRRIYDHVRTNSVLAVSTSGRARSYSSGLLARVPEGLSTVIAVEGSGLALCAGWCYHYDAFLCRTKVEDWKAQKKGKEMIMRMLRESHKPTDAFFGDARKVLFCREVHALKEKLSDRKNDSLDAEIYLRELAALIVLVEMREKEERMTNRTLQAEGHQGG